MDIENNRIRENPGISNSRESSPAEPSIGELAKLVNQLITEVKGINSGDSPWLTIEEAADYIRLSVSSIRKLVSNKSIPHVRRDHQKGRSKLFFHKKQLDLWMFTDRIHATKKQRDLYRPYTHGTTDEN